MEHGKQARDARPQKAKLTRRSFFDRVVMTVAGGAVLMIAGTQEAAAKVSKMAAKYRGSPKSGKSCSGCSRYQGSGKCSKVAGRISSTGYCKYYAKKKSSGYYTY